MADYSLELTVNDTVYELDISANLVFIPEVSYPGAFDAPPGTQNETITFILDTRALKSETATRVDYDTLVGQFNDTRATVDDLGAQLGSVAQNQGGLRADVDDLDSRLADLNIAGLTSYTLNSANELVYNYSDGSTKNLGFFPADRFFKGTATSPPTGDGIQGQIYRNTNPAYKNTHWLCTVSGAAGVAVWEPRGGPDLAPIVFDFNANGVYLNFPGKVGEAYATPQYFGGVTGSNVAWKVYTNAGLTSGVTLTFPYTITADLTTFEATVTGLASGTKAGARLKRTV